MGAVLDRTLYVNAAIFKLALFVSGFLVMFAVETIRPCRKWDIARPIRLFFHAALSIFNSLILRLIAVTPLFLWLAFVNSKGWGMCSLFGLTGVSEILLSLVLLDMFDYWWHRWNHRVPFLWRFHKVHHVDTHVDVTTSLRFHPGELLISSALKAVWILIVGPSVWTFVIFEASVTLASQFHHTNVDFPDRVENAIRSIIVTPRYHAAHHTVSPRTGNNNFSTILILWDKMFDTYRQPDYEEMQTLGLPKGRATYLSFASTLKGPFSDEY